MDFPRYVAFSDGSSTGKVGPGGWGCVIYDHLGWCVELSGGEEETTNQRQEIMGAIQALETIEPGAKVMLVSDSAYVLNCMKRKWYEKWQRNGWRNSAKKPVVNRDLWERLIQAAARHKSIHWVKVKGHAKAGKYQKGNQRADELAVMAKKEIEGKAHE